MTYKNYIWDLGGTLLDNYEASSHAFAATLWHLAGRSVLHDSVYAALKISTDAAVERYAADIPNFLSQYKELEASALARPILFDGAKEVLSALTSRGCKHFMISHRDQQVLDILSAAGIRQYFTKVITANDGFPRKPSPASFNYLIKSYQLTRSETLTIGDRSIDSEAGNAAGIATAYFRGTPREGSSSLRMESQKSTRLAHLGNLHEGISSDSSQGFALEASIKNTTPISEVPTYTLTSLKEILTL